jgi:hypothetical protein
MSFLTSLAEVAASSIGWFDDKEKAVLVVIVMTAIFVVSTAWVGWKHLTWVARIKMATSALREAMQRPEWTAADRLNATDGRLKGNLVVGSAWLQYRASMRQDPGNPASYVNLVDPSAWFTLNRLNGAGYEKWVATLANVFLCLGLLFTFVGLSAALLSVGSTTTPEDVRRAVDGILKISSAKFITSIAGILLYVILLIAGRRIQSVQTSAARQFAVQAQRLTTLITPEILLVDQLAAAREQTERMKRLADDVAVAFEARLTDVVGTRLDALPTAFERSVQPIVSAIERMGSDLCRGTDETIGRVAERLEAAAETMRAAQGDIGNSGAEFGNQISNAATTMNASVVEMTQAIEGMLSGLQSRIGQVDVALQQGADNINGVSRGLTSATSEALAQALSTISEQSMRGAELARQHSEAALTPLMASLQDLARQISQQASVSRGHLVDGSEAAAHALAQAGQQMSDRLAAAMHEASSQLQAAAGSMAARMEAAVTTFQAVERAVAQQVGHLDKTGTTITSAGQAFGAASIQLRAAAEPIHSSLETVSASARKATESLEATDRVQSAVRDATAAMQKSIAEALKTLEAAAKSWSDAFAAHEARFATTDEALAQTIEKLINGTNRLGDAASNAISGMNDKISAALGALRTGVEEIGQNTEGLEEATEKLSGVVRDLTEAMNRNLRGRG